LNFIDERLTTKPDYKNFTMKIPPNVDVFEGELAVFWFDEEGFLCAVAKNTPRTLEMQKENFDFIRKITSNNKVCLLAENSNGSPQDKETRAFSTKEMPNIFKAMAVLSASVFGQTMSKSFVAAEKPPIPIQHFADEKEARGWLRQYL